MVASKSAFLWQRLSTDHLESVTPEAAKALLAIKLGQSDVARFNELVGRSKTSSLTEEEQAELERFLEIGNFLTLIHAKARLALQRGSRPKPRRKTA